MNYTFSPYEVPMPLIQPGLGAMPGFTPCIISQNGDCSGLIPLNNMNMFFPLNNMNNVNAGFPLQIPSVPFQSASVSPLILPPIPSMSPPMLSLNVSSPIQTPVQPPSVSQPPTRSQNTYLGAALGLREVSRSRSPSLSVCSDSDSGIEDRGRSCSRESGVTDSGAPSKRALVDSTLSWMESVFHDKYDNDGTRGENVLRLKVKTVIALEHIVEFIALCHKEGLIESISCPVSTKKGRQHVRGYLAYIKGYTSQAADRIEAVFNSFNAEKGYPFKTLHRNPASTL